MLLSLDFLITLSALDHVPSGMSPVLCLVFSGIGYKLHRNLAVWKNEWMKRWMDGWLNNATFWAVSAFSDLRFISIKIQDTG